jgi:SdrD B-like domain/Putative Ig domain
MVRQNSRVWSVIVILIAMLSVVGLAQNASAQSLKLRLEQPGFAPLTIADNGPGDADSTVGKISINTTYGTFTIVAETGVSKPVVGGPTRAEVDLNSFNLTSAAGGTLTLTLEDADFLIPPNGLLTLQGSVGGTMTAAAGSSVSFTSYANPGNALPFVSAADVTAIPAGTFALPLGTFTTPNYANNASATFNRTPGGPYSIFMQAQIVAKGSFSTVGFDEDTFVTAPPCTGSIGDFVWDDLNKNGLQDAGEPGIPNVLLQLFQNGGSTPVSTTVTTSGGFYQFTGLCAGNYTVVIPTPPAGYTPTTSLVGNDRSVDSNGSPASVTLPTDNSSDQTIDFGYVLTTPPSANCVAITAVQGVAITPVTMTGTGGVGGPYTFSATGLPAGLTMSSTGTISGTPTVTGTFSYTVTVQDSAGNTGTVNCSVTVNPPPAANCVTIIAVQGTPITPVTMVGSGGVGGPYTFSATGLPAGLTMSTTGTISGTPTVTGTFSYTVTVKDSAGNTGTVNCSVTVNPPVTATCVSITAIQGVPITPVTMTATGGAGGPYTFSATGLPAGVTMSTTGTISGTPTVSGTFSYTVTVKDSAGNTGTVNCSVTVNPPPPLLTKTASPTNLSNPFGLVTYTYTVTNGSGVTLTNVKVVDDNGTPSYTGDDFVVATIPSLAPGASQTFTVQLIPAINLCATVNSVPNTPNGVLIAQVLPTGDVKITFRQSTSIVDNTYGANISAGWSKHNFTDLTGSDKAQFQIFDGKGNKVLDFLFDYITSSASYPSGYGTLGVSGGDGGITVGNASWILGVLSPATLSDGSMVRSTTTITTDLNQSPAYYGYTTNSPSTSDPNFPGWDVVDGYTVYISKAAFGANGFGSVAVPLVHNSPPKIGTGALYPSPCASYTVTNTATETVNLTVVATATATVNVGTPSSPTLTLAKTASASTVTAGTPVTYTYVVKNTGSTTLTNVSVVDDNATPDNPADDFTVGTLASLAPGASSTFTTTIPLVNSVDPTAVCQTINGANTIIGYLVVTQLPANTVLPNGTIVGPAGATQVVYRQSTSIVDNNYGTSATAATGWAAGHKFSDFTGSDMAEFRFTDGSGFGALDVGIDYLTASATYPSGYGTLGATGGDGKVFLGSATAVLYATTTMTTNLNQSPSYYSFTINSPAPSNPLFGGWELVDGYTVVINNTVFGSAGFGGVTIPLVHNSPSKLAGVGKLTPGLCGAPVTNTATATALAGSNTLQTQAKATVQVNNAAAPASPFVTINQTDWGGDSNGPHDVLVSTMSTVYGPAGIKIGGGKYIILTTPLAIQDFLPQGGAGGKLTMNYTLTGAAADADTTEAGALAGNVLALKLNVDYSTKGYLPAGFGTYVPTFITSGPFKGKKVSDILNSAMNILGGGALPPGVTYDGLNTLLDQINNLFPPQ